MAIAEGTQSREKKTDKIKTMTGMTEQALVGEKYTVKGKVKRPVGNLFKTKRDKEAQTKSNCLGSTVYYTLRDR